MLLKDMATVYLKIIHEIDNTIDMFDISQLECKEENRYKINLCGITFLSKVMTFDEMVKHMKGISDVDVSKNIMILDIIKDEHGKIYVEFATRYKEIKKKGKTILRIINNTPFDLD